MEELTKENCDLFLATFMDDNELNIDDIAKAISCPDGSVERILAGITQPGDKMLMEVGLMLGLGFERYTKLSKAEKKTVFEKIGTISGGALGFSAISTAVGALGLPGLSAAGVTSGLGALGAILGGTMVTGIGVAATIPIASGALGYGVIKGAKRIFKKMNKDQVDFDPEWEVEIDDIPPDDVDSILMDVAETGEETQERSTEEQSPGSGRKITIGNDELILHIRKNHPECTTSTASLGKSIWVWIRDNDPEAEKGEIKPCLWGSEGDFVSADQLPKSATQFSFDVRLLPALYMFLDELGETETIEM